MTESRSAQGEFAVAREDGKLEITRFSTREQAEDHVAWLYAEKARRGEEAAKWERENVEGELHPGGTNEPWWNWHKRGWKDREWRVVVREVTPWRDA